MNEAYVYGGLIVLIVFSCVLIVHNYQLKVMELGMKMRIAACAIIYRKALKLSKTSLAETTIGQMVNLLSNDVGRFDFTGQHMHNLWIAPLECIVIMWLLQIYVGPTGLVGVVFLLAFIPFQSEYFFCLGSNLRTTGTQKKISIEKNCFYDETPAQRSCRVCSVTIRRVFINSIMICFCSVYGKKDITIPFENSYTY